MCGRYFFQFDESAMSVFLQQLAQRDHLYEYATDEVFPSQSVLTMIWEDGQLVVRAMKWGMTTRDGRLVINARMEGLAQTGMFRKFQEQRCLVPCNSFYEWEKRGNRKEKILITKEGEAMFFLAGIYNDRQELVLLTGEAKKRLAEIHHRTPLIITKEKAFAYLRGELALEVDNEHLVMQRAPQEKRTCFFQASLEL